MVLLQPGNGTLQVLAHGVRLPATLRSISGRLHQGRLLASHSACVVGQIWSDDRYLYVCTKPGEIKRAALSSF